MNTKEIKLFNSKYLRVNGGKDIFFKYLQRCINFVLQIKTKMIYP